MTSLQRLEADLLRFYQIDLLDFYRGTLAGRRLGFLIRQLPGHGFSDAVGEKGQHVHGEGGTQ